MSFEGKNWYGQYIDYSEKKKWPKGFICPYTGTIFYNISYIQQISGEHLQDHWSSGNKNKHVNFSCHLFVSYCPFISFLTHKFYVKDTVQNY